nr:HigA family addiction module antitoxin [Xanthomonas phaseoli]
MVDIVLRYGVAKLLIHPGVFVRRDCLERHNLNVTDAAYVLGVSRQALSNLLSGRAGISPEMALRLDMVFGGGAEAWLHRQTEHDLAAARRRRSKLVVHSLTDKPPRHNQPKLF